MALEQTKRCPKCGYDYELWIDTCPDCGVPLETRPKLELIKGERDENADPQWTIVTNVPNAIIGSFIKGQLEDAGIPVLMFRSRSADIAEFSHNDFVPQDLLVPRHRFRDARRLIDSAPGNDFGPHLWDVSSEDADDYDLEAQDSKAISEGEGNKPNAATESSDLPEGWTMLPTEADLRAFQEVRRTHGESLRGWYWSDEQSGSAQADRQSGLAYKEELSPHEYEEESPHPQLLRQRASNPYGTQGYAGNWSKPSKWIRIFYAILLLVMSLPFIFQLLGEMSSILGIQP